jgi:serine/threonine-protein kinase MRCK
LSLLKETLPPNKNSAFKGYHLPFIGYTYTENSLLNDCTSLIDLISKCDITSLATSIRQSAELLNGKEPDSNDQVRLTEAVNATEYAAEIEQLKRERLELMAKIHEFQASGKLTNGGEVHGAEEQVNKVVGESNEHQRWVIW